MTASELLTLLTGRGEQVATAESLTGGLVCAALTAVSGASEAVTGGIVAYLPETKAALLGVPDDIITEGVVTARCAAAMAIGAVAATGAAWAVATTGVAGPEPSEGHPPGLVYLAVHGPRAGREQATTVRTLHLSGTRDQIRTQTVEAALQLLLEQVSDAELPTTDTGHQAR